VLALVLVAVACGGDDDDSTADTGDTEPVAGDTGSDTSAEADAPQGEETTTAESDVAPSEVRTDVGVDDQVIRIGYNADLSGAFATLVIPIIDATEVYWEMVNEAGGIADRVVEPIVLDNAYDVPKHLENYEILAGEGPEAVVMIGQSTGSPHTAATADLLVEDDLAAIPLSFYSGWADPAIGANVFEVQANYCVESLNGITYMSENHGDNVAIISFPGEYGQDGAQGAKKAVEELGLNVVYDGEGAVVVGADQTPVINEIVNSGADFVWTTINPSTLAEIMGGAIQQGFTGAWAGNAPSFNFQLLGTDSAPAFDQYYTHFAYNALWNTDDTPGMTEVVTEMRERRPAAPISDQYLIGWINGIIVQTILEEAAANGDLTRAGVLAAANSVTVDLKGLAPNQTWAGDPNDYIVRESYVYDVDASLYTGDLTVSDEEAGTGFALIDGPYASPLAQEFEFEGACFVTG
jgi:ABC-type branched-subunit amino acid transport system substrate-binding protein